MSKYKGLFTFDVENHRYLPVEQADGIIMNMDYHPKPEPLLECEEDRKKFKTWAKYVGAFTFKYDAEHDCLVGNYNDSPERRLYFSFPNAMITESLTNGTVYTLAELCGEEE